MDIFGQKNDEKTEGLKKNNCTGSGSRFEGPRGHELRHKHDALLALGGGLPGVVEAHDVWVLQALQHPRFLLEALPLRLGQLAVLQERSKATSSAKEKRSDNAQLATAGTSLTCHLRNMTMELIKKQWTNPAHAYTVITFQLSRADMSPQERI